MFDRPEDATQRGVEALGLVEQAGEVAAHQSGYRLDEMVVISVKSLRE